MEIMEGGENFKWNCIVHCEGYKLLMLSAYSMANQNCNGNSQALDVDKDQITVFATGKGRKGG